MNGLSSRLPVFLAAFAFVSPAMAQTVAPAPRAAVQQVAPFTAPMPPPKPVTGGGHHAAPAPVVNPPAHAHAQKVAPAKPDNAGKAADAAGAVDKPAADKPGDDKPADAAAGKPPPPKPVGTGLPLPRWASLRADEVNLRSGPGMRYPIEWVYHRRELPVQIEREFEGWRLIEDQDGVKGWVHQATLTNRRSFVVTGGERVLHRTAAETAEPVAKLKPGVVGRIRICEAGAAWCEVQTGEYRGFLRRDEVYGLYPNEPVN